ncbi:hypothetical protein [Cohnella fermenti]|uniref:Uncharacterized protein n=1 Tax=Cohnella fermenti TaxID=2565925 RepID=A0A4S4BFV1_9BACL|nr:hypothetical protein [Cohnella fermenti]THF73258.1 hypothetical protein E6C55_29990 [Cohnella fermenti]
MSRLDGNERWKSKMLLAEHQEQYEKRSDKPSGYATPEELRMIRDAIMLPHMLTISSNSLTEMNRSKHLFKSYFEDIIQEVVDNIGRDCAKLQRELRDKNIKVFDDEVHDGILYYRYRCRGYEDRFGIVRETLRSEISVRLARYAEKALASSRT